MKYIIIFSSVTYALKAKNFLLREGININTMRTPTELSSCGCGYAGIINEKHYRKAAEIIKRERINVKEAFVEGPYGEYVKVDF